MVKLNAQWRSARFGLRLLFWAASVVGYVFLVNAAITLALIPSLLSTTFFGYLGVGATIVIAMTFVAIVRRAVHIDSETLREQLLFVGLSIAAWVLLVFQPSLTTPVLHIMARATPWCIAVAAVLAGVGSFYLLTAWGSLTCWLSALATFALAALTLLLAASVMFPGWAEETLPEDLQTQSVMESGWLTVAIVGCLAIFTLAFYLRQLSLIFNDRTSAEYIINFIAFQVGATAVVMFAIWVLKDYEVQPVLQIGEFNFDLKFAALSACASLVAAAAGIWLSRCIAAARAVVNLNRLSPAGV